MIVFSFGKLEKAEINEKTYDFIVCTTEALPDVLLLKKKISKERMPSIKGST
jgi:hypothetical protein